MTTDPFEQLRVDDEAVPPDPTFVSSLRARIRAALDPGLPTLPFPERTSAMTDTATARATSTLTVVHLRQPGRRCDRLVRRRLRCRGDHPLHGRRRPHRPRRARHRRRQGDALRRVPRARRAGADVGRRHSRHAPPRGARRRRHLRAGRRRRRPGSRRARRPGLRLPLVLDARPVRAPLDGADTDRDAEPGGAAGAGAGLHGHRPAIRRHRRRPVRRRARLRDLRCAGHGRGRALLRRAVRVDDRGAAAPATSTPTSATPSCRSG